VPFAPDVVDFFFPGHLMAAKALQKDIESTHWVEANEREARASGDHDRHVAEAGVITLRAQQPEGRQSAVTKSQLHRIAHHSPDRSLHQAVFLDTVGDLANMLPVFLLPGLVRVWTNFVQIK
jgi:hypothetical protein